MTNSAPFKVFETTDKIQAAHLLALIKTLSDIYPVERVECKPVEPYVSTLKFHGKDEQAKSEMFRAERAFWRSWRSGEDIYNIYSSIPLAHQFQPEADIDPSEILFGALQDITSDLSDDLKLDLIKILSSQLNQHEVLESLNP